MAYYMPIYLPISWAGLRGERGKCLPRHIEDVQPGIVREFGAADATGKVAMAQDPTHQPRRKNTKTYNNKIHQKTKNI